MSLNLECFCKLKPLRYSLTQACSYSCLYTVLELSTEGSLDSFISDFASGYVNMNYELPVLCFICNKSRQEL